MICKHCNKEFLLEKPVFANHVRWCSENPKVKDYKSSNTIRGKELANKKFGEYKKFDVSCKACNKTFSVIERELLFPQKENYFCTRVCANSEGGKSKARKYHTDDVATYYTVAWRHHKRECCVCGENLIVAAHHINEIHSDNNPKNLVPLCPTHHQYIHSKYRVLIEEKVNNYIQERWGMGLLG